MAKFVAKGLRLWDFYAQMNTKNNLKKTPNTPLAKSHLANLSNIKLFKILNSTLGSMKFAVVIILIFALALVYGTFMESYHGREFANKLVYKSWWFMGMQGLIFLSILTATLARLPLKKALYGFYTLHAGLLLLFIGSFLTYEVGVDGMLELMPNEPSNKVMLQEEQFLVMYPDGRIRSFPLPNGAFPQSLDYSEPGLKIKNYIPFAKLVTEWLPSEGQPMETSSAYTLYNDIVSQELILSLNPNSDFESMQKMGPLSVHYMPESLYTCFTKASKSGFLIWDTTDNTCQSAEEAGHEVGETPTKNRFMLVKHGNEYLKFFPDFSPLPLNDDLSKITDTPYRAFSKNIFEGKPNLFLFGEKLAYYSKRKGWQGASFTKNKPIKLPWMNFNILLDQHHNDRYPAQKPVYTRPIQDSGEVIEGDIKAIQIEFYGRDYWVRNDAPLALESNGENRMRFQIKSADIRLPYQITLNRFKMDKNPGTNDPASFESFVSLLDGRDGSPAKEHHVFMNNPLKYDDFTFYQSSYFQVGPDKYGSAFSVNYDPGRPLKYFGSFLLVFGSAWHFFIRRKKKRRFFEMESSSDQKNTPLGDLNA